MKKEDVITVKEMRESVFRSGYLLEQRVESMLQKRGYYVEANAAYPDPITGKSREIDIDATSSVKISRQDGLIFPRLLCECENNRQPIVFFVKDSPFSFLYREEVKYAGLPVKFLERSDSSIDSSQNESNNEYYVSLSEFLNFEKYHHYCKGSISTQYCTFTRKSSGKPWVAFHEDVQHTSLTNLVFALEASIEHYYKNYSIPEEDEIEEVNIEIYYPLLILQGPLYTASIKETKLNLQRSEHVQYRKEYFSKDKQGSYQIDVITEPFLCRYVDLIEKEMERTKGILKRKKEIVRESLDRIVDKARNKLNSESFRDVFEF